MLKPRTIDDCITDRCRLPHLDKRGAFLVMDNLWCLLFQVASRRKSAWGVAMGTP